MRRPSGRLIAALLASIVVGYVFSYLFMILVLDSSLRQYGTTLHIVAILIGMALIFILDKPLDLKTFDWPESREDEAERLSFWEMLWGYMTTVDHKKIGQLYLVTALFFFLVGGTEALLMRLQLMRPNGTLLGPDVYNQVLTMHGTTMIFLVAMPMIAAFSNYIVPLQVGALDMAFPRLNAFSVWLTIFGGLLLHVSFLAGGAPTAGWFSYAPLTESGFSPTPGMDFWVMGLQVLGISSIATGINLIVTIIRMRAPGMTLNRMPIFSWTIFVQSFLILFAFPSFTVAMILLYFDRFAGTSFFIADRGGDPLLWQHLFWFFGHPEVYIVILPAMGIVSEVLPVFSRKPIFGYTAIVYSTVAIGFLGFSVWAHHMFATGLGVVAQAAFSATSMFIAVPTAIKIFNWIATIWGGSVRTTTAMHFASGFVGMFVIGGLSGIMLATVPINVQVTDTYFVVAHMHYVLFGGTVLGLFAGLYYWAPKVTGRLLNEHLGKLNFWLLFIGFNLAFFPMHVSGLLGMPRRIYTYPAGQGWEIPNLLSTMGAFTMGVAVLVFLVNVYVSLSRKRVASGDPWDAWTLEWATTSPPPAHNFDTLPPVNSARPLWDLKHPERADHGAPQPTPADEAVEGTTPAIHLPPPSYWPITMAAGVTLTLGGFTLTPLGFIVTFVGLIMFAVSTTGWIREPVH